VARARRARKPALGEKVATAKTRYYAVGPRKVRDVADLIRGLTVPEAEAQLAILHRPSSVPMLKRLLKSAVSNANHEEHRHDPGDLIVGVIYVDGGPTSGRYRPRAYGRTAPIRKRSSHITVELYTRP
jgi:large subunit ribosomal protein L22